MKNINTIFSSFMLAISWWPLTSNAQAFINLGFESAVIKPIPNNLSHSLQIGYEYA